MSESERRLALAAALEVEVTRAEALMTMARARAPLLAASFEQVRPYLTVSRSYAAAIRAAEDGHPLWSGASLTRAEASLRSLRKVLNGWVAAVRAAGLSPASRAPPAALH